MTDRLDLNTAARLFAEKKYDAAAQLCMAVAARAPDNARAFYLLGLCSYMSGQREQAAALFKKAVQLNPRDADSLYNLGVASSDTGKFDDAVAAYRALLAEKPDYTKAYANLGLALLKTGEYIDGLATLKRAVELDPADSTSPGFVMEVECQYLPPADRTAACNNVLARANLTEKLRYTALVYRATAEWLVADDAALTRTLAQAAQAMPKNIVQNVRNVLIFATFLDRLLAYRKQNAALYTDGAPLFLVGDSHSLSYSGVRIGAQKISAHLIIGTKAWHLSSPKPSSRKGALEHYMSGLPKGAHLLCAFGEIDCRTNTGIMPYWEKNGGDLETLVEKQVADYVAWMTARAALSGLALSFLAIPAPHPMSGGRQKVVALFNAALARHAAAAGHAYIDLYTPTLGTDGFGMPEAYIDLFHLKPEILSAVLKA